MIMIKQSRGRLFKNGVGRLDPQVAVNENFFWVECKIFPMLSFCTYLYASIFQVYVLSLLMPKSIIESLSFFGQERALRNFPEKI